MRYFLVDKITSVEVGKEVTGVKCVTLTDQVLHDHFPDHPILPGALIVEGMAQLAGYLLEVSRNTPDAKSVRRAVLAQIDKMKFHEITGPGECLEMKARIESMMNDAARVSVEASVAGKSRVRGNLTFFLIEIDSEAVAAQRKGIYKVWTRDLKDSPPVR